MSNEAKLQAIDPSSADPTVVALRALLEELCSGRTISEVRNDLRAAEAYKSYAEQQMGATVSSTNITCDKRSGDIINLPRSIVPEDRKEAVQIVLEWIRTPPVVKRFSYRIVDIQRMVEVVDPVTGMYMAPNQHRTDVTTALAEAQDRDLAKLLQYKIKNVEYISLWKGSTAIGVGDHRVLYNVNPDYGLDMRYAWTSVCSD